MTFAGPRAVTIEVPTPAGSLFGDLVLPGNARSVVAFAHGSGSSRFSPRNRAVADILVEHGLGTFLVDLLTTSEGERDELTSELRFDIPLIGRRMVAVVDALTHEERTGQMPIGLFGASTGAAAALIAAAERPDAVHAVVSRGGRPDLAAEALPRVRAATLFLVGGADREVLQLNREALGRMHALVRDLVVVEGATHLFEEPGALERVAALASAWFVDHLGRRARGAPS
jgi:putative phosphoribosyl transferase